MQKVGTAETDPQLRSEQTSVRRDMALTDSNTVDAVFEVGAALGWVWLAMHSNCEQAAATLLVPVLTRDEQQSTSIPFLQ